ncbi:acyl-CoA thioesterase [Ahrensia sp. 13_GOM-1096m]|uniref:acyl-CoA thioesterase n=1 Tax=Ahrensia sp. 13_GOM-1096m TaxID=1380380 RepID=UPI00047E2D7F|nr:acyl-CoA thioesterase [Ahrensia sp. 13_GOM-1096m]
MNLVFRLLWVIITAFRRSKLGMMEESVITLRVMPNDLDTNIHMNNGRYLTIMDLGRVDFIIRSGMAKQLREQKWYPVVGSAKISYKRSLSPFQRYELKTRVHGWDEKWIYLEQEFVVGDVLYARGIVKTLFLKDGHKVPSSQVTHAIGYDGPSPEINPADEQALS